MNRPRLLSTVLLSSSLGVAGLAVVLRWRRDQADLDALAALGPHPLAVGLVPLPLAHLAGALRLRLPGNLTR